MNRTAEYHGLRATITRTETNHGYFDGATDRTLVCHAHGKDAVAKIMRQRFGVKPV